MGDQDDRRIGSARKIGALVALVSLYTGMLGMFALDAWATVHVDERWRILVALSGGGIASGVFSAIAWHLDRRR